MSKMREVILYLEEDTDNLCFKDGDVIWYDLNNQPGFDSLEFISEDLTKINSVPDVSSNNIPIEDLVRLKTAGFDSQDIIEMHKEKIV